MSSLSPIKILNSSLGLTTGKNCLFNDGSKELTQRKAAKSVFPSCRMEMWICTINMYFPPCQGKLSLFSLFLPLGFPHPYNFQASTEAAASQKPLWFFLWVTKFTQSFMQINPLTEFAAVTTRYIKQFLKSLNLNMLLDKAE